MMAILYIWGILAVPASVIIYACCVASGRASH